MASGAVVRGSHAAPSPFCASVSPSVKWGNNSSYFIGLLRGLNEFIYLNDSDQRQARVNTVQALATVTAVLTNKSVCVCVCVCALGHRHRLCIKCSVAPSHAILTTALREVTFPSPSHRRIINLAQITQESHSHHDRTCTLRFSSCSHGAHSQAGETGCTQQIGHRRSSEHSLEEVEGKAFDCFNSVHQNTMPLKPRAQGANHGTQSGPSP